MKLAVVVQMGRTLAGADSLDTTCIELALSMAKPGLLPSSDIIMISQMQILACPDISAETQTHISLKICLTN